MGHLSPHGGETRPFPRTSAPESDLHLGRLRDGDVLLTVQDIFDFTGPGGRETAGAGERS